VWVNRSCFTLQKLEKAFLRKFPDEKNLRNWSWNNLGRLRSQKEIDEKLEQTEHFQKEVKAVLKQEMLFFGNLKKDLAVVTLVFWIKH